MRSITEQSSPARIRDAAIHLFAHDGFAETSVRDIAARADVTAGLVMHHFGSKESLRATCDAYVAERLLGDKAAGTAGVADIAAHFDDSDGRPLVLYLRRMLSSDSPGADEAFDRLVAATRQLLTEQQQAGILRQDVDVASLAPVLTAYGLAPVMLPRQLARGIGSDRLDESALATIAQTLGSVLSGGLYADSPVKKS